MLISVIIPTHNPRRDYLERVLAALGAQTLPKAHWELIVIDNASQPAVAPELAQLGHSSGRVVREERLGLTAARLAGIVASHGEIVVLVDDDNVLALDYLQQTSIAFERLSHVGALGGKSIPQFETPPASWLNEFFPLLAVRDLGDRELVSSGLKLIDKSICEYPLFAPIGAGMALRREAVQLWLTSKKHLSDRRGNELTSSGDNDIVLTIMKAGWGVAYLPQLGLTHLIQPSRLEPGHLARLNRGIQKSWTQVLALHNACPWPQIANWTVPLRKLKAWFTYRAWNNPAARIRWQGACGHFEGRAIKLP